MAIQTNPLFEGMSGSVNKQLVFRQLHGKTVVSNFPKPSKLISAAQLTERQRFRDAVSFARVVVANSVLKERYRLLAVKFNLRSAWNAAIAEFMCKTALKVKADKIRFKRSIIRESVGFKCEVRLSKCVPAERHMTWGSHPPAQLKVPPSLIKECIVRLNGAEFRPPLSLGSGSVKDADGPHKSSLIIGV